jgi:hypothetical protein
MMVLPNHDSYNLPASSNSNTAEKVSLSSLGRSEHRPLDRRSGSIGITRSTKYTDVARCLPSRSSSVLGRT